MTRNIHLRSIADLWELERWLAHHGTDDLALDTETTGLDVFEPGFLCGILAVAHSDGSSVTCDGRDSTLIKAVLRKTFADGRRVWAHHANYDAWVLRRTNGIKLSSLLCSVVSARVCWPGRRDGHSLKKLRPTTEAAQKALKGRWVEAAAEMGIAVEQGNKWLAQAVRYLPVDDPTLIAYVVEDAVETARLVAEIAVRLQEADLAHWRRDLSVDRALRWTGYDGLSIDRVWLSEVLERTEAAVAANEAHFGFRTHTSNNARYTWVADHGINLPPTERSLARHEESLELNAEDPEHPVEPLKPQLSKKARPFAEVPPEHESEWRRLCTSIETGLQLGKLKELLLSSAHDGMAHPNIKANSARTGRMSISNPATQNLAAQVKPALIAKPGMVLVSADLVHVEPSIMAAASGDTELKALCSDPDADIYEETAAAIWGDKVREKDERHERTPEAKELRTKAKVVFLGLGYGMGNRTFAASLGLPITDGGLRQAQEVRTAALGAYPDLGRWLELVKKQVEAKRQIFTLDGRRLPRRPDQGYLAPSYIVQGTAASIFKRMLLDVHQALAELPSVDGQKAARIWLPVHDEIIVECPDNDDYVLTVAHLLAHCMSTQVDDVPLWAEPHYLGRRWRKDGARIPIDRTEGLGEKAVAA